MKRTWITTMAGFLIFPFALMLPALGAENEPEKATRGTLDTAAIEREITHLFASAPDCLAWLGMKAQTQAIVPGVV